LRAKQANVEITIMPAIDSTTHEAMFGMESIHENCYSMIGLHPCSVNEDYNKELDVLQQYLGQKKVVAIGEIGLDFYWDKTFTSQQYEAFHQQIEIALKNDLPIVIHSRNAIDECINVVSEHSN